MLAFKASSNWRSSARALALIRAETTGPRMGVPFDFPRLLALVVDLDPALEVEGGSQVSSPSLPLGVDGGVGMAANRYIHYCYLKITILSVPQLKLCASATQSITTGLIGKRDDMAALSI